MLKGYGDVVGERWCLSLRHVIGLTSVKCPHPITPPPT